MKFEQAYSFLIQKLEKELPPYLTFHNSEHTKEVVRAVQHLSASEGISGQDAILLDTAALFYNSRFLEGYNNRLELSCKIAKSYLPQFEYSPEEIDRVCNLIQTTKLSREPENTPGKILHDANLYYLGSDKHSLASEKLYNELRAMHIVKNRKEWREKQISFLESHQFFTKTAITDWDPNKRLNLVLVRTKKTTWDQHRRSESYAPLFQDFFLIALGVVIAGFGLKGFLVPNHFIDGGVTGIALLVCAIYNFDLAFTTVILNLPFIALSYFTIGKTFALKTFICVILLGVCLFYINYPIITSDKLLISIFGGFFVGVGAGLVLRAGCAIDGIDVLAVFTLKRTSFTISEIILFLNVIIFGIAAFHFGIETALYSILTYLSASKTIDYVVEGVEAYTGVTIISSQSETIKYKLVNELGRGITVYKGERGFLPESFEVSSEVDVIFTVITRLELRKLKTLVHETDPKAFVFASPIKDAAGGIIKRRRTH